MSTQDTAPQDNQDDDLPKVDELTALKARADQMGITYHPAIGVDKLREKITAAMNEETPKPSTIPSPAVLMAKQDAENPAPVAPVAQAAAPTAAPVPAAPVEETSGQKRNRLRKDATRLVRVNITCMNPAKKDWDGEIITTGNSAVGTIRKFIPFNTTEGYHIEHMLLQQLQERRCQIFVTKKTKNGVSVREGKLIKEFGIEMLDPLSEEELRDLAQRQAMAKSID